MNAFVAVLLVVVFLLLAALVGFLVVKLVYTLIEGGRSINNLNQRVTLTRNETAQVATSIINNIGSNVSSNKLTVLGTVATTGDNNISLTTSQVPLPATLKPDPSRGAGWLYLTNSLGTGYADLGLSSMWADKGITVSPGACINFGSGSAMCGDGNGALTGSKANTGMTLVVAPGTAKVPSNLGTTPGPTRFPAANGTNQIMGDTSVAGDLYTAGALTFGSSGAGGGGIMAGPNAIGTRVVANLVNANSPATAGLGFSTLVGTAPGIVDALTVTRSMEDNKTHVKVFGTFEVCDEMGNYCQKYPNAAVQAVATTSAPASAPASASGSGPASGSVSGSSSGSGVVASQ
ncbi:MAG: hypothetical protein WDW38_006573 [Sanguina aurantia]